MCGIFGYVGQPARLDQEIMQGLRTLEYRGYDSWGVALWTSSSFQTTKEIGKIGKARLAQAEPCRLGVGHTRWATHGGVTKLNAHPHLDCHGDIALVHNGILENWAELKPELIAAGHTFVSQTDTEVLAHWFEGVDFSDLDELREKIAKMDGHNAFVALHGPSETMIAYRSGSPLVVATTPAGTYVASDPLALAPHTSKVVFLPNHCLLIARQGSAHFYDVASGQELSLTAQELQWSNQDMALGNYPHFMLKEIAEQARVLRLWAQLPTTTFDDFLHLWRSHAHRILTGCGSSSYVSLFGQHAMASIAKNRSQSLPANELSPYYQSCDRDSLVVAISQSGESIDVVEHLPHLKARGAALAAVVNREHSTLHTQAEAALLIQVGPEQAVVATKSFIGMISAFLRLAALLAKRDEVVCHDLAQAADVVDELMTADYRKTFLAPVVALLQSQNHLFVLGKGSHWPIALETALKIKEISYIHAEGFAAGELKHGVIALIEAGMPCILFCPDQESVADMLTAAHEIKARGGIIIGVSEQTNPVFDFHIPVPTTGMATPLLSAIVGQLLAYELTVARNLDPDKPRNLAKSVTVK